MAMPAIEIQGLTKDFPLGFWRQRQRRSLDNLTLQVEEGEVFGFLGPNGAGKTTTLKLLMRLIFPTAGTARIRGRSIDLSNSAAQAVGMTEAGLAKVRMEVLQ